MITTGDINESKLESDILVYHEAVLLQQKRRKQQHALEKSNEEAEIGKKTPNNLPR